jgi:hypothetical protein
MVFWVKAQTVSSSNSENRAAVLPPITFKEKSAFSVSTTIYKLLFLELSVTIAISPWQLRNLVLKNPFLSMPGEEGSGQVGSMGA